MTNLIFPAAMQALKWRQFVSKLMMFGKELVIFCIIIAVSVLTFCEFLIYYAVLSSCVWPSLSSSVDGRENLKVILLADTHLLGPRRGHWFDKLRREWQMHRAFQTTITLFHPDVIFILGDVFDEGQWSDSEQFALYLARFGHMFHTPDDVQLEVVPGNHDVGFHYVTTPRLLRQFHTAFNLSSVQLRTIRGTHFVLINSMAFEGDDCDLCTDAEKQLKQISQSLDCGPGGTCGKGRPILLQHFPMYRKSDAECNEADEAPIQFKDEIFREKWDCLSKDASEKMYNLLLPRVIFTGHTHHGCHVLHRADIHEYTVPSFSWRNKDNPTFTMAVVTPSDYAVSKCFMPKESTVIFVYSCAGGLVLLSLVCWLLAPCLRKAPEWWHRRKRKRS